MTTKKMILILFLFHSFISFSQNSSTDNKMSLDKECELASFVVSPHVTIYPNSNIAIENLSCDSLLFYTWDFGDGTIIVQEGYAPTLTHYYRNWGVFYITLTVEGDTSYAQMTDSVIVNVPMPEIIGYTIDDTVCGDNANFYASIAYTVTRQWYFNENPILDTGLFVGTSTNHLEIIDPIDSYIGDYYCIGSNDSGFISTDTVSFIIGEAVSANFSVSPLITEWPNSYIGIENLSDYGMDYYKWNFGDGYSLIQYEYSSVITHFYDTCGILDLRLTVKKNLCSNTDSEIITVFDPNFISDTDEKISIFPNPVKNYFQIKGISNIAEIIIFTIDGKEILRQNITNNQNIDVSTMKNGIYILIIKTDNNNFSLKFTKE